MSSRWPNKERVVLHVLSVWRLEHATNFFEKTSKHKVLGSQGCVRYVAERCRVAKITSKTYKLGEMDLVGGQRKC